MNINITTQKSYKIKTTIAISYKILIVNINGDEWVLMENISCCHIMCSDMKDNNQSEK